MAFTYNETNNIFIIGDFWTSPTSGSNLLGPGTGPITVTQDGVIQNSNKGHALSLDGGIYTIAVNGQIASVNNTGIYFNSSPVVGIQKVTVGATGNIYGGEVGSGIYSNLSLNVTNAGTISGGNGAIFMNGAATEILTVVNTGTIWTSDATTHNAIYANGSGARTITNSGDIYGTLFLFGGTQKITNSVTGWIGGGLDLDEGVDTITNAGKIDGNIFTRGGDDVLANSGTIGGYIEFDSGLNKFTNSGVVNGNNLGIAVLFGGDADTMTNSGTIAIGDVLLGEGANSLTNSGTIGGVVGSGTGIDKITNSGTITGSLQTGEGNDVVKNTGQINNLVDLGLGDDTYTGGKFVDQVYDFHGKDTYALGAGDDIFIATALNLVAITDGLGDKVDGGTNTAVNFARGLFGDIYDFSFANTALHNNQINADGVAHTNAEDKWVGGTLAKGTAVGELIGLDLISNFETFKGSVSNDLIYGGAIANAIYGGAGFDHLHGGAGNDWIDGGDNDDQISGDAGADRLTGGLGYDSFIYHKLTDSTVGKLGRDVITDFTNGEDVIDLSAFVAVTGVVVDTDFTGLAGSVRVLTNAEGWLVQLDSDGDSKVDLSIQVNDVNHNMAGNWELGDFGAV